MAPVCLSVLHSGFQIGGTLNCWAGQEVSFEIRDSKQPTQDGGGGGGEGISCLWSPDEPLFLSPTLLLTRSSRIPKTKQER